MKTAQEFPRLLVAGWVGKLFGSLFTVGGLISVVAFIGNDKVGSTAKWVIFGGAATILVLRATWVASAMSQHDPSTNQDELTAAMADGLRQGANLLKSLRGALNADSESLDHWMKGRLAQVRQLLDPDQRREVALVVWLTEDHGFGPRWTLDPRSVVELIHPGFVGHLGAVRGGARYERIDRKLDEFAGSRDRKDLALFSEKGFLGVVSAAVRHEQQTIAVVSLLTRDRVPDALDEAAVVAFADAASAAWLIEQLRQRRSDPVPAS